ncbi:hypothetical protein ACWEGQ_33730 [Streptomyces seoulensis]|nr:hypothetical protein HUT11_09120 [Streptomyces seoulensis]
MGETDPFVCLLLTRAARPGRPGAPWGMSLGDRVGVARSYLTPVAQWHTIWRTLANPGE